MYFGVRLLPLGFALCAGVSALIGDYICTLLQSKIYIAIADNATHAIIGGFSYITIHVALKWKQENLIYWLTMATLIASLIDIDHFVTARSFKLADATSLPVRPFLHSTTLILVITLFLLVMGYFSRSHVIWHLGWLVLVTAGSHHIRDSTRRGFWFFANRNTPPVPYWSYIALQIAFPLLLSSAYGLIFPFFPKSNASTVINL